jgi:hypothetical protein
MQWRAIPDPNPVSGRSWPGLFLIMATQIAGTQDVKAQQELPREFPRTLKAVDRSLQPALVPTRDDRLEPREQRIELSTNEIRTDSPAVPGAKMVLEAAALPAVPRRPCVRWSWRSPGVGPRRL